MRTILKNSTEVAHIWASRSQPTGRAGNMSFNGDTICSYGWWPMAKFIGDNIVLINSGSYSISTSRHQNITSGAIPEYYTRFHVADLTPNHNKNLENYYLELRCLADRFWASISWRKQSIFDRYQRTAAELRKYAELFSLVLKPLTGLELSGNKAAESLQRTTERTAEQERIREQALQQLRLDFQRELDILENDWLAGEPVETSLFARRGKVSSWLSFSKTRLRLNVGRNEIETSLGAYVSIESSKRLYERIKRHEPVKGEKIGSYTIVGFNGKLRVGCHVIDGDEIERFAKIMNW